MFKVGVTFLRSFFFFAVIEGDSIEGINRASEKIQVIIDEVSY